MKIAVGIATTGRPEVLKETLTEISRQSRLPDVVAISPAHEADVQRDQFPSLPFPVRCVVGPVKALTVQRNAILDTLEDVDVVVFFDDDYFPAANFISEVEQLMSANTDVVVATGTLIADGIKGPGISAESARQLLAEDSGLDQGNVASTYGGYGCNFAVRLDQVRKNAIRFDEELPLYGWQEDIDFSRQLARYGKVVRSSRLRGVHLGVKKGRTSGVRFGYSQVANPVYLINKGTMSVRYGLRLALGNLFANLLRAGFPEPHIDRFGRLRGNLIAGIDLAMGRLHPRRILDLS